MALEDLMLKLIASLDANTEAVLASNALRETAIETVRDAAATGAKATTKASTTKATTPAAAAPTAEAPAASGEDRVTAEQAEQLKAKVSEYIGGTSREEERTARKEKVRNLFQHDKIKVPGTPATVFDAKNVMASAYDLFVKNITGLIAKGDITTPPAAAEASDLDL